MTFQKKDWLSRSDGLELAKESILKFREESNQIHLDEAVWHIWRFGEYAVNALLELAGERTDRGHDLGNSIEILKAQGWVSRDYKKILNQLERYRKKADYGSYSRSRSVHYNAGNIQQALDTLLQLQQETQQKLTEHGKLP